MLLHAVEAVGEPGRDLDLLRLHRIRRDDAPDRTQHDLLPIPAVVLPVNWHD